MPFVYTKRFKIAVFLKMRINSFYLNLVLACVLVYFCNGAPPKNERFAHFTDQEHELIFKMLESQAQPGVYRPSIWKDIQTAHEEKVKAKVKGFPRWRAIRALREHFAHALQDEKIQVSKALRELYTRMKKSAITHQEQDFINRELLESDDIVNTLLSEGRWINIQKKHERKVESGALGFANRRSWGALRSHFRNVMMPKNLVHEDIKRKFPEYFKPKEGVTSTDEVNRSRAGSSENEDPSNFSYYRDQEHELMFKMLAPQADFYDPSVWVDMKKAFEEKRKAKVPGFVAPRTIRGLKQHLKYIVRSDKIQIPAAVRDVYEQIKRMCITRQEQDLINRELARTDLVLSLTSIERWKMIQEKFEEKRKSGTLGFANKRSPYTLRNHFNKVMRPRDLVNVEVKKRFPNDFRAHQGATSFNEEDEPDSDPEENVECGYNEDGDVWDPILEDLERLQQGPVK